MTGIWRAVEHRVTVCPCSNLHLDDHDDDDGDEDDDDDDDDDNDDDDKCSGKFKLQRKVAPTMKCSIHLSEKTAAIDLS